MNTVSEPMDKGPRIFIVLVVITAVLVSTIGLSQLLIIVKTPSESDAIGDWKLSKYDGYSYDGNIVQITTKDSIASDYSITIDESGDGSALVCFSRCLLSTYYGPGDSCWGYSADGSPSSGACCLRWGDRK